VSEQVKHTAAADDVMFHVTDSGAPEHVLLPLSALAAPFYNPEAAVAGLPLHSHAPM
jgi:hypothetical protein